MQRKRVTVIPVWSRRQVLGGAWRASLGLLVARSVAACSITTRQQRYTVEMSGPNMAWFTPGSLTVPLGATVVWKNNNTYPHTVTCDPTLADQYGAYADLPVDAQPWDSGDIYAGEMWSHTFLTPGQYIYFSRGAMNMAVCSAV